MLKSLQYLWCWRQTNIIFWAKRHKVSKGIICTKSVFLVNCISCISYLHSVVSSAARICLMYIISLKAVLNCSTEESFRSVKLLYCRKMSPFACFQIRLQLNNFIVLDVPIRQQASPPFFMLTEFFF